MTKELEVRKVDLPTMTVASVVGFGKEPEPEALRLMKEYAGRISAEMASAEHPTYGFNNPDPQPGKEGGKLLGGNGVGFHRSTSFIDVVLGGRFPDGRTATRGVSAGARAQRHAKIL